MKNLPILLIAVLLMVSACSDKDDQLQTVVNGTITVADSVDSSGDYSGISVIFVHQENPNSEKIDTLKSFITDRTGSFEGIIKFPQKRYYGMVVERNGRNLGNVAVILADNDTLNLSAELPGLQQTLTLNSIEHEAMRTYMRVERGFERVSIYARSGALPDSQYVPEILKWSDLYWDVYQQNENTLAGLYAAEKSVNLLNGVDKSEMLSRIDQVLPADQIMPSALSFGKEFIAFEKGFDAASRYLDSLAQITENEDVREIVMREKIKMYFDSSRVKEAKTLLNEYEKAFADNGASIEWTKRIRYDLNYLAPGVQVPDFSFVTMEGDTVNNQKLEDMVYILEISPLANGDYQNDYDRTMVINEIYKNYGLKVYTIPLDRSEITVNAFFEERRKLWPVAQMGSFDVQEIVEKFNVVQVPTRLLVDRNGVLIRKYERGEFRDVLQGLNRAFSNQMSPS